MGITKTIEANVRETGEIVLNAKLLSDMVHRMPGGEVNITVGETGKTTSESGGAQFEIQSMSGSDFPDLPHTGAE